MSTTNTPLSIDLSWLKQARLLQPQIRELSIHPHIKNMGLPDDNLVPNQKNPTLISENIKAFLTVPRTIVSKSKSNQLQVISGIYEFHLARQYLDPKDRISAMVINSPTIEQINQLMLNEFVISPIILRQNLHVEKLWKYKAKFENLGILEANKLHKRPKTKWASWIGCDVRKLHD